MNIKWIRKEGQTDSDIEAIFKTNLMVYQCGGLVFVCVYVCVCVFVCVCMCVCEYVCVCCMSDVLLSWLDLSNLYNTASTTTQP